MENLRFGVAIYASQRAKLDFNFIVPCGNIVALSQPYMNEMRRKRGSALFQLTLSMRVHNNCYKTTKRLLGFKIP